MHRAGAEGVLVAVEPDQRGHCRAGPERLTALMGPVLVPGTGAARHEVEQPGTCVPIGISGQVDHPGQLLRAASTLLDGLGRHVMPDMLIDPEDRDPGEACLVVGGGLQ